MLGMLAHERLAEQPHGTQGIAAAADADFVGQHRPAGQQAADKEQGHQQSADRAESGHGLVPKI